MSFGRAHSVRPCNKVVQNGCPGAGHYEVHLGRTGRMDTAKHATQSHNKSGGGSMGLSSSERNCNKYPKANAPAPGDYEVNMNRQGRLNTTLHASQSHNKSGGGSMGLSSSERHCNKYPRAESPGPGEYEANMTAAGRLNTSLHSASSHNKSGGGTMGLSSSDRPCNKYPRVGSPAPGDYEVNMNRQGHLNTTLHASQSHNKSGGGSMGLSSSERNCNKYPRAESPGPGEYEANMTAAGRLNTSLHSASSHNKSGGGTMGLSSSDRPCNKFPRAESPGPGQYEVKMTARSRMDTSSHAMHSENKSGGGSMGLSTSQRPCNQIKPSVGPAPGDYEVCMTNKSRMDTAKHVA